MRPQEHELVRIVAKHRQRSGPENDGLVVRTTVVTSITSAPASDPRVLDHGVVPRDELLGKLLRLQRAHAISQVSIHVHVTPTL